MLELVQFKLAGPFQGFGMDYGVLISARIQEDMLCPDAAFMFVIFNFSGLNHCTFVTVIPQLKSFVLPGTYQIGRAHV